MKLLRWLVVIVALLGINVCAQETNQSEMARLQTIYLDNLKKLEEKYNTQTTNLPAEYDKELNVLEASLAKQKNLDGVLAVQREKDRRKAEPTPLIPDDAIVKTPTELKTLQEKYKNIPHMIIAEHTKEYVSLSNAYIAYLEKAKGILTQNMKINEALEYKNEIENVKTIIAGMLPKEMLKTNVVAVVSNKVAMLPVDDKLPVEKVESQNQSTNSVVIDLGDGVKMEFAFIPKGEFMMGSTNREDMDLSCAWTGSKAPAHYELYHKVKLTRDYWMGIYEVTQEQWEKIMGNNPSKSVGVKQPVEQVDWYDCQKFIDKLNKNSAGSKIPRTYCFRLPTEAEWEYACRAGTTTRYNTGDEESDLNNAKSKGKPSLAGTAQPNKWGLYDMHGNVAEWCLDWAGDYDKKKVINPTGSVTGNCKIWRGGSWASIKMQCRSSYRYTMCGPQTKHGTVGFRVVIGVKQ